MSTPITLFSCIAFVAAVITAVSAAPGDYGYFGWTNNGCSSSQMTDAAYNSLDTWAAAQWWTITFTDDTQALGGMVCARQHPDKPNLRS